MIGNTNLSSHARMVVTPGNYKEILAWADPQTIRCQDAYGVFVITRSGDVLAEFGDTLVPDGHGGLTVEKPVANERA